MKMRAGMNCGINFMGVSLFDNLMKNYWIISAQKCNSIHQIFQKAIKEKIINSVDEFFK